MDVLIDTLQCNMYTTSTMHWLLVYNFAGNTGFLA